MIRTPEGLGVDIATEGTTVTAALAGELDLGTSQSMVDVVTEAVNWTTPGHLVLDFDGITFCDSVGITALVRLRQECEANAWQLRIVNTQHPVRRMLVDFTGLGEYLNVA